jgi:hypothetical protein
LALVMVGYLVGYSRRIHIRLVPRCGMIALRPGAARDYAERSALRFERVLCAST